jgi:hypothetical protein
MSAQKRHFTFDHFVTSSTSPSLSPSLQIASCLILTNCSVLCSASENPYNPKSAHKSRASTLGRFSYLPFLISAVIISAATLKIGSSQSRCLRATPRKSWLPGASSRPCRRTSTCWLSLRCVVWQNMQTEIVVSSGQILGRAPYVLVLCWLVARHKNGRPTQTRIGRYIAWIP